ncbi:prepilin peptidase [Lactococcus nasutitermitis]|uniref:Prepilin peptidase n=1 Tax=Lactococcus nasutitermitis TaxID=1652957 RepID=A0ABV9JC07_9LACT|nr:A24 family peptidase [Lactococcus nasutitermitis]
MENLFAFIIGSVFGSFFGVVIDRLYTGESIIWGRSHCNHCQMKLHFWELIPIFSQLFLKNRCRHCKVKIPPLYIFLEILIGICFLAAWQNVLTLPQFLTLLFSILSSIFDYRAHQFPLNLWILFAIIFLLLFPLNISHCIWIILALIAEFKNIKIGTGDFLWLFIASFSLTFIQLALLIQISSFLGILYILLKNYKELPFIPFLSIGYLILLMSVQIH